MIRVTTVEDDGRYRASLEALLRLAPGIQLSGSYAAPASALAAAERVGPMNRWDVVLMDLELPGMTGVEATRRLKRLLPDTAVVVLTVFEQPGRILEAICAGADGYLTKDTPPDELLAQIRAVAEGGSPLTSGVARIVLDLLRHVDAESGARESSASDGTSLTSRERDVLRCLMAGSAYKQVAAELGISIDTVRTHIRHIYKKLQVHSVAEAATKALRAGLV